MAGHAICRLDPRVNRDTVTLVPGMSFDRVAAVYDETRGGQRRGDSFAAALAPWIVGPRVVELGVGTGVIARGLGEHGFAVVGFDLSEAMLRRATERVGARVGVADADRLPLADASVDTVVFVWVLQLVEDPVTTLAEAARVVRPGGRVVAVLANAEYDPHDEIAPVLQGLAPLRAARRPERSGPDELARESIAGLSLVTRTHTPWDEFPGTVTEEIEAIEGRIWSSLFDVDDATWAEVVVPVLEQLRGLPDPDRVRIRRNRQPLFVWERVVDAAP
jgi:SAM-dependent methyltransferase